MALKEIGYEVVDWIHLAQDTVQSWPLVNTVSDFVVKERNFFSSRATFSLASRTLLHGDP
jgi:hypothetical protein